MYYCNSAQTERLTKHCTVCVCAQEQTYTLDVALSPSVIHTVCISGRELNRFLGYTLKCLNVEGCPLFFFVLYFVFIVT